MTQISVSFAQISRIKQIPRLAPPKTFKTYKYLIYSDFQ